MLKPILLTLVGLLIIFTIARKCKSTKMFWILFISLCGGFVGGSIAATFITNAAIAKKDNCVNTETKCTQVSCAKCFEKTCNNVGAFLTHKGLSGLVSNTQLAIPNFVKVNVFTQSSKLLSNSFQAFNPDTDIGTYDNTS